MDFVPAVKVKADVMYLKDDALKDGTVLQQATIKDQNSR